MPASEDYPRCKNTRYDHDCHPYYARKYDGYCLECANAGVRDLIQETPQHVANAIASALADLRHSCHVGTLSVHDRGLVERAIRELERVSSGVSV